MEEMSNFIKTIMINDLESGKVKSIVTRFPPEPNAYLHIGHARAIITNFELANSFGGKTNLRFDDTNPAKEDVEFVKAIEKDIEWLGYHPAKVLYGSDYFDETYELAVKLIKKGLAYVCDLTPEETSKYRGDFNTPGIESPYRNRSVEENLELFKNMKEGKYQEGERVLRAKIDMASPNINMRDPVLYRILYISHHRTKDKWCIYPMYDFAHPIQDAIEGITHSLCSLEYDNHRPLYDWVVEKCEMPHVPQQIEFGRLNITNTVMSKRYLRELVNSKKVTGYDDPRMPTLVGLARRGYTPESIKNFVKASGLSRINSTIEGDMLEHFLREDLKLKTNRLMAVLDPLKIVITNYEEGKIEYLEANNNNENEELGTRQIAFSRNLYIDRNDFVLEKPDKHYKRLALGLEVRLFHAYFIKANEVVYDKDGNIVEVHCTYDPRTKSGSGFNERKPNGTIQFVEATTAKPATFNLFETLVIDNPEDNRSFLERLNPNSWTIKKGFVEGSKKQFSVMERFQFVRDGYYVVDKETKKNKLVFNRIVSLKSAIK
ncbi:MAG TPA: glutamine--tRNA ligase/YqeY domain fusion protein [Bacilli bacterium]|jgi:glutaminyl-tRNA synthetase|nr:glutamine--tRNA ligase/YqeY domain fusion protein [Acholeplasmataceae bacterium]HNZ77515.1 glutamine--tRNA ligase/YqeY domain fusion protein [Bacilli bacterium]HOH61386.1 glutamine--tRNA ligase/YqeY domain fusion protein [Bacilli bacterium]HPB49366.1 glutamine--tRNA ligase/YqeY domain fusion protein [Bacilli bacterium]HPM14993.1 glutamine--tRNA ligase/YqeY domain fusion protein [Bacilli bacterium]